MEKPLDYNVQTSSKPATYSRNIICRGGRRREMKWSFINVLVSTQNKHRKKLSSSVYLNLRIIRTKKLEKFQKIQKK